jgi:hypothetical protein
VSRGKPWLLISPFPILPETAEYIRPDFRDRATKRSRRKYARDDGDAE